MQYKKNFYAIKSNEAIFKKLEAEKREIGYYNLPYQDTTPIKEFAATVTQKDIVVLGIGGSSLGTYAIHKFLQHTENNKRLHFLDSTDPRDVAYKLKKLDFEDARFIIISKSGNTIETISILKYIKTLTHIDGSNSIVISELDSPLSIFANKNGIKIFEIPKNVGGRFSVFSSVGLLPLAIMGVDIDELLKGCREVSESFFAQRQYYEAIMEKARFIVENKNRFNINVIFSYSSLLDGFNKWYVQLWGESLGKKNINETKQALTPISLLGPIDQHSFLQLIMEGKRDKTVTFIKVKDFEHDITIPDITLEGLEELDYLNTIAFKDLINRQADATIEALESVKDVPCDVITIERIDAFNIAKLMFSYQLLTSTIGAFVQINTYDQPGVEAGKEILIKKIKETLS